MSPPDDAARAERLAAALRENLKRRKAQAKGRVAAPVPEQGAGGKEDTAPADGAAPGRAAGGQEPPR
jgi:hypothetical protein